MDKEKRSWDEIPDDEVIGEIRVEEQPYESSDIKYQLYVMLKKELPEELLIDPDADVFNYQYKTGYDLWKVEKISDNQLPRLDKVYLRAVNTVDPDLYKTRYKGKPVYRICLTVKDDFEGYRLPMGHVSKNEVAYDAFTKWLGEEGYEALTGSARKVKLFPWEKPSVSRIPLTKGMLEKGLDKKRMK